MKVFYPYIVVEPEKPPEKTASGIHLAEQIKTYPPYAKVIQVPEEVDEISPGDRVIYKVYTAVDIDDDLAVVPLEAIIGIADAKSH